MSEKFSNLVAEDVRTDKGFKDFHVNVVAKDLQAFIMQPVTASQVYNTCLSGGLNGLKSAS
jgi:hypothetical protein